MDKLATGPKRSQAFLAASKVWSQKAGNMDGKTGISKGSKGNPISIDDDDFSDKEGEIKVKKKSLNEKNTEELSPIKMFYNPSFLLDDSDKDTEYNYDTVKLDDLIGSESLVETYQFNYLVDLKFFLTHLNASMRRKERKITFITGSNLLHQIDQSDDDLLGLIHKYDISSIEAPLPMRYGSHHSKMMINFFIDGSVEIIIMTCNLQKIDFMGLTQMCWRSGKLYKGDTNSKVGARFKRDLTRYLRRYGDDRITGLCERLEDYSFSNVHVELIASVPGSFDMSRMSDESEEYGYGKLYQILKRNRLLLDNCDNSKHFNIVAQVSSIAYPIALKEGSVSSIFTHLLCPLIFSSQDRLFEILRPGKSSLDQHQQQHRYTPQLIFPTAEEVSKSNVGFASGEAIHFDYSKTNTHKKHYHQILKHYLCQWSNPSLHVTGRETIPPHVKLYMCDNGDNWKTIRWIMLGSHNLSQQAWGGKNSFAYSSDPKKYKISSYELGVLISPSIAYPGTAKSFIPTYCVDSMETVEYNNVPIRLPFALPPLHYGISDIPWSSQKSFGTNLQDKFGNFYIVKQR